MQFPTLCSCLFCFCISPCDSKLPCSVFNTAPMYFWHQSSVLTITAHRLKSLGTSTYVATCHMLASWIVCATATTVPVLLQFALAAHLIDQLRLPARLLFCAPIVGPCHPWSMWWCTTCLGLGVVCFQTVTFRRAHCWRRCQLMPALCMTRMEAMAARR